jgi:sodium-dependent dicarboxylate transporter 2/3/5
MNPEQDVIIDRRPLWLLIIVRGYRYLLMGGLAAVAIQMGLSAPPVGLSIEGWRVIILFVVCIVLWIFQLIPLAITGLLAIAAQPLLGIASYQQAYSSFGHPTVFFLLGVFILAAAFMKTGLSTRLAIMMLRGAGRNPRRMILQILATCALMSFIMSEHAVAAMMFPIILEFARALEFVPYGGSYGRLLFLSMAWGCVIGGIGTLLGGARAPLAIGFLEEFTGSSISFMEWIWMMIPVVIIMFFVAYFVLVRMFSIDVDSVEVINTELLKKRESLGRIKASQQLIVWVFVGAVLGWILLGHQVGMATVAILAVMALFVFNVVRWTDLEAYVNWGVILLYGGAIGLGAALHRTGAGAWMVQEYILPNITNPFALVLAFVLLAVFMTEAISNSAVVAVLVPIALSLASSYGIDPKGMILLIAGGSGLAYLLPMSTPAVAIAYSSGYYRLRDIAAQGILLHIISVVVMLLAAWLWWPVLGIHVF